MPLLIRVVFEKVERPGLRRQDSVRSDEILRVDRPRVAKREGVVFQDGDQGAPSTTGGEERQQVSGPSRVPAKQVHVSYFTTRYRYPGARYSPKPASKSSLEITEGASSKEKSAITRSLRSSVYLWEPWWTYQLLDSSHVSYGKVNGGKLRQLAMNTPCRGLKPT